MNNKTKVNISINKPLVPPTVRFKDIEVGQMFVFGADPIKNQQDLDARLWWKAPDRDGPDKDSYCQGDGYLVDGYHRGLFHQEDRVQLVTKANVCISLEY